MSGFEFFLRSFQDVLKNILDLDESVTRREDFVQHVCGAKLFPGSVPLAHRYGGHQVFSGL